MNIKIEAQFDPTDLIQSAIDSVSLSGLGSDGTSEYEVADCEIEIDGTDITVNVTVERIEGKFASKDEVAEAIIGELETVEGLEGISYDDS